MKNLNWCIYTYRHRRAFEYCVNKLIHDPDLKEEMLKRARIHDMDKMVMYLFLEQKEAQKIHMMHQPHHLENSLPRTYEDLVETIIDADESPGRKDRGKSHLHHGRPRNRQLGFEPGRQGGICLHGAVCRCHGGYDSRGDTDLHRLYLPSAGIMFKGLPH